MKRVIRITASTLALLLLAGAAYANPGKPNFSAAIFGDGQAWGTKGTATLPTPNENNLQAFDILIVIRNGPMGQLPVSEAAPGNPAYNGGKWFTHFADWDESAEEAMGGSLPILTYYDEVLDYAAMGYLIITPGSFPGGPPPYFQCPLLPVK
ncbi:MAG TPA: hypothetical protein VFG52_05765 [Xanthomonadales bacterium]|nr:hypothetical protein [Xanthomonadales bacterium]